MRIWRAVRGEGSELGNSSRGGTIEGDNTIEGDGEERLLWGF